MILTSWPSSSWSSSCCLTYTAARKAKGHQASQIIVTPMFAVVVWRSITRSAASGDPFGPRAASTSLARLASTVVGGASSFDRKKHRFRSSSRNRRFASTAAGLPTSVSALSRNAFSSHTPVYSLPCVPPTTTTLCFAARLTQRRATNIAATVLLSMPPLRCLPSCDARRAAAPSSALDPAFWCGSAQPLEQSLFSEVVLAARSVAQKRQIGRPRALQRRLQWF